jgi:Flp pilus assembly protein TadD
MKLRRPDRNLAGAHATIGFGKIYVGRAEEPVAHIVEALRLSPRDTMAWMNIAGIASNRLGQWEQAIRWFRWSVEANRNYPVLHFALGAALAKLGRMDEAHSAVKAGLALNPAFTISRARAAWTAMSDDPTYLAQLEPVLDGMLKAGVPEQWPARRLNPAIIVKWMKEHTPNLPAVFDSTASARRGCRRSEAT